jgi:hypothetical protein
LVSGITTSYDARQDRRYQHRPKIPNITGSLLNKLFSRTVPDGDCLIWQGARLKKDIANSYGVIGKPGQWPKICLVHRYIYEQMYGLEPDQIVMHTCDRKACINPAHLFAGTSSQNNRDAYRRGLKKPSDQTPKLHTGLSRAAKLKPADVRIIRKLLRDGVLGIEIAKQFGVCDATISSIKLGVHWSHVQ